MLFDDDIRREDRGLGDAFDALLGDARLDSVLRNEGPQKDSSYDEGNSRSAASFGKPRASRVSESPLSVEGSKMMHAVFEDESDEDDTLGEPPAAAAADFKSAGFKLLATWADRAALALRGAKLATKHHKLQLRALAAELARAEEDDDIFGPKSRDDSPPRAAAASSQAQRELCKARDTIAQLEALSKARMRESERSISEVRSEAAARVAALEREAESRRGELGAAHREAARLRDVVTVRDAALDEAQRETEHAAAREARSAAELAMWKRRTAPAAHGALGSPAEAVALRRECDDLRATVRLLDRAAHDGSSMASDANEADELRTALLALADSSATAQSTSSSDASHDAPRTAARAAPSELEAYLVPDAAAPAPDRAGRDQLEAMRLEMRRCNEEASRVRGALIERRDRLRAAERALRALSTEREAEARLATDEIATLRLELGKLGARHVEERAALAASVAHEERQELQSLRGARDGAVLRGDGAAAAAAAESALRRAADATAAALRDQCDALRREAAALRAELDQAKDAAVQATARAAALLLQLDQAADGNQAREAAALVDGGRAAAGEEAARGLRLELEESTRSSAAQLLEARAAAVRQAEAARDDVEARCVELLDKDAELSAVREALAEARADVAALRDVDAAAAAQAAQLVEALRDVSSARETAGLRDGELEKRAVELDESRAELAQLKATLEAQCTLLAARVAAKCVEADAETARLGGDVDAAKAEAAQFEAAAADAEARVDDLEGKVADLEGQLEAAQSKAAALGGALETAQAEGALKAAAANTSQAEAAEGALEAAAATTAQVSALKADLETAWSNVSRLEVALEAAAAAAATAAAEVAKLSVAAGSQAVALAAADAEVSRLRGVVEARGAAAAGLERELDVALQAARDKMNLRGALAEREALVSELKAGLVCKDGLVADLRSELEARHAATAHYEAAFADAVNEVDVRLAEVRSRDVAVERLGADNEALRCRAADQAAALLASEKAAFDLEADLDAAQAEAEARGAQLRDARGAAAAAAEEQKIVLAAAEARCAAAADEHRLGLAAAEARCARAAAALAASEAGTAAAAVELADRGAAAALQDAAVVELRAKVGELRNELGLVEARQGDADLRRRDLVADLVAQHVAVVQGLQRDVDTERSSLVQLRREVEEDRALKLQMMDLVAEASDKEINALRAEVARLEAQADRARIRADEEQAHVAKLRIESRARDDVAAQLRVQVDTATGEAAAAARRARDADVAAKELLETMAALQSSDAAEKLAALEKRHAAASVARVADATAEVEARLRAQHAAAAAAADDARNALRATVADLEERVRAAAREKDEVERAHARRANDDRARRDADVGAAATAHSDGHRRDVEALEAKLSEARRDVERAVLGGHALQVEIDRLAAAQAASAAATTAAQAASAAATTAAQAASAAATARAADEAGRAHVEALRAAVTAAQGAAALEATERRAAAELQLEAQARLAAEREALWAAKAAADANGGRAAVDEARAAAEARYDGDLAEFLEKAEASLEAAVSAAVARAREAHDARVSQLKAEARQGLRDALRASADDAEQAKAAAMADAVRNFETVAEARADAKLEELGLKFDAQRRRERDDAAQRAEAFVRDRLEAQKTEAARDVAHAVDQERRRADHAYAAKLREANAQLRDAQRAAARRPADDAPAAAQADARAAAACAAAAMSCEASRRAAADAALRCAQLEAELAQVKGRVPQSATAVASVTPDAAKTPVRDDRAYSASLRSAQLDADAAAACAAAAAACEASRALAADAAVAAARADERRGHDLDLLARELDVEAPRTMAHVVAAVRALVGDARAAASRASAQRDSHQRQLSTLAAELDLTASEVDVAPADEFPEAPSFARVVGRIRALATQARAQRRDLDVLRASPQKQAVGAAAAARLAALFLGDARPDATVDDACDAAERFAAAHRRAADDVLCHVVDLLSRVVDELRLGAHDAAAAQRHVHDALVDVRLRREDWLQRQPGHVPQSSRPTDFASSLAEASASARPRRPAAPFVLGHATPRTYDDGDCEACGAWRQRAEDARRRLDDCGEVWRDEVQRVERQREAAAADADACRRGRDEAQRDRGAAADAAARARADAARQLAARDEAHAATLVQLRDKAAAWLHKVRSEWARALQAALHRQRLQLDARHDESDSKQARRWQHALDAALFASDQPARPESARRRHDKEPAAPRDYDDYDDINLSQTVDAYA
ncbi:hypothetical protein M885DRAFT_579244 [Pelagophyceae sp. CCMP2097]|nr:hypothetical protein M885DRAFT_579244 [Pelagophyceae sp. CCMP2097]